MGGARRFTCRELIAHPPLRVKNGTDSAETEGVDASVFFRDFDVQRALNRLVKILNNKGSGGTLLW